MKRFNQWAVSAICFAAVVTTAQAQQDSQSSPGSHEELFRAEEASLDAFGSISVGQQTIDNISGDRVRDNGRAGAGLGLNYFITRHIGLGADAYTENTAHSFVDNASGNVYLRLPLDEIHLAPYIFGGGGRQFDPNEVWFGQAGVGVEFRFTKSVGVFADARYVMPEDIDNFGVARAGLRFTF